MKTTNITTKSFGKPITAPILVPVKHRSSPICINNPFSANGQWHKVTAISFGTPHGAVFVDDVDSVDVESLGAALGTHVLFPKGASIVFIQVIDKKSLKVRLWQRDEGEIGFSSEAVCVAGVAAMMNHKVLCNTASVSFGENVFQVKWDRGGENVDLTGSAELLQEWHEKAIVYRRIRQKAV